MSNKLYEENDVSAIAIKIRSLTGSNIKYKAREMPKGVEEVYSKGVSEGAEPLRAYFNYETNNVVLPKGVTVIRGNAFRSHSEMKSVSGLDDVTTINQYAFADCTALSGEIKLPEVLSMVSRAFYNCSKITSVYMPKVMRISNQVFYNCTGLTELTFQSTPTLIDPTAFQGCTNIATINVPWAEGKVANAPWGATNCKINYNYTEK